MCKLLKAGGNISFYSFFWEGNEESKKGNPIIKAKTYHIPIFHISILSKLLHIAIKNI